MRGRASLVIWGIQPVLLPGAIKPLVDLPVAGPPGAAVGGGGGVTLDMGSRWGNGHPPDAGNGGPDSLPSESRHVMRTPGSTFGWRTQN
jgi:hypothetical protein